MSTGAEELRVWLDDDLVDRRAPDGWTHVTTAWDAIELLKTGRVVELSLDHDLSDDEHFGRGWTSSTSSRSSRRSTAAICGRVTASASTQRTRPVARRWRGPSGATPKRAVSAWMNPAPAASPNSPSGGSDAQLGDRRDQEAGRPAGSNRAGDHLPGRHDQGSPEDVLTTPRDPVGSARPSRAAEGTGPVTPQQPAKTSGSRHGATAGNDGGEAMTFSDPYRTIIVEPVVEPIKSPRRKKVAPQPSPVKRPAKVPVPTKIVEASR